MYLDQHIDLTWNTRYQFELFETKCPITVLKHYKPLGFYEKN